MCHVFPRACIGLGGKYSYSSIFYLYFSSVAATCFSVTIIHTIYNKSIISIYSLVVGNHTGKSQGNMFWCSPVYIENISKIIIYLAIKMNDIAHKKTPNDSCSKSLGQSTWCSIGFSSEQSLKINSLVCSSCWKNSILIRCE